MNRSAVGVALAATGGVIFGASATLAGFLTESIDPVRLGTLRVVIAAAVLAPLAIIHRRAIARAPGGIVVIGLLQVAINALLFLAISRIGVGPAIGVQFLAPVYIVVWDRLAGHAHPRPVTWAAVVAAVVGVGLLVEVGDLQALDALGLGAALVGGLGLATYLRLGQHVSGQVGGVPLAAGSVTFGGLVGLFVARPWSLLETVEPATVWAVVALGTVAMALPLTLEIVSLSMTPARVVGVVITIEPVAAALTAWWFLDEALVGLQIVGLVLIVAAVGAVSWTTSSRRAPKPATVP